MESIRVIETKNLCCAECGQILFGVPESSGGTPLTVYCSNRECAQYGALAKVPVKELPVVGKVE